MINDDKNCELELRVLAIIVLDRRHWNNYSYYNNAEVNKHHELTYNKQTTHKYFLAN